MATIDIINSLRESEQIIKDLECKYFMLRLVERLAETIVKARKNSEVKGANVEYQEND